MTIHLGDETSRSQTDLSSRPERTQISRHAALEKSACVPFRKEGRVNRDNATKLHRKSGVAEWRDLRFFFTCDSVAEPDLDKNFKVTGSGRGCAAYSAEYRRIPKERPPTAHTTGSK
jgi:hypothetical protein